MSLNRISSTVILTALLAANVVFAQATNGPADPPTDSALDRWGHIAALNTLTVDENSPFYLKVEFQIFDLKGKPGETGTAEVWWSKQRRYEVIASPSWSETSAPGEPHQPQTRQSYLVRELLEQITRPMRSLKPSPMLKVSEEDIKFGATTLHCLANSPVFSSTSFCTEPAGDALRVNFDNGASILRNKIGKFRNTHVPLELTTSYGERKAITGKIVALTSIPPEDDHIKPLPEPVPTAESATRPTQGVVSGRKIGGSPPVYPEIAKMAHITGSVIIHAMISKEGNIASPIVIASPDPSLTNAALDAVRTWKYQPYRLNGEPTEVDTLLVVNFNLNPSR